MKISRELIARHAIERLGVARARDGTHPVIPSEPNKTGFEGVDLLPSGKYRSRIRYCDALNGNDTRITLGTFKLAENAGLAYRAAHIHLWGALSYFVGELVV